MQGVGQGPGGVLLAVDLAQRDDLADVVHRVEAALLQFGVVPLGVGREAREAPEQLLAAGAPALVEQGSGMVGVLEVPVPVVAARMPGDEPVVAVDADPVGVGLQHQALGGMLGGHRVAVGLEGDAEAVRGAHGMHVAEVVDRLRQRPQQVPLLFEQVHGAAAGLAVDAHVGHRVEPLAGDRVEVAEVGDLEAGQQVLLDVAHAGLDAPLLVPGADVAGGDLEPVVAGEVDMAGIEHRRLAAQAAQHRGLEVVDHDPRRHPAAERLEGVHVAAEEVLEGLRDGELDMHHAAVAEHQHEEAQLPAGVADVDRPVVAPSPPGRIRRARSAASGTPAPSWAGPCARSRARCRCRR